MVHGEHPTVNVPVVITSKVQHSENCCTVNKPRSYTYIQNSRLEFNRPSGTCCGVPASSCAVDPDQLVFLNCIIDKLSIRHLAARWQTPSRSCTGTIRFLPTVNVACNKLYQRKLPALKRFATCALAAYAATRTTWKSLCALPAAPAHAASAFEFRC
mgnify:CR=1 FL=1